MPLSSNIAQPIQKSKILKVELKPILGGLTNVNTRGNATGFSPSKSVQKKPPKSKLQHANVCICRICTKKKKAASVGKMKPRPPLQQNDFRKSGRRKRFKGKGGRSIQDPTKLETTIRGEKVVKTVDNVTEDDIEMFALEYPRLKEHDDVRAKIMSARVKRWKGKQKKARSAGQRSDIAFNRIKINRELERKHLSVIKAHQVRRKMMEKLSNERLFNAYGKEINLAIVLGEDGKYVCNRIDHHLKGGKTKTTTTKRSVKKKNQGPEQ